MEVKECDLPGVGKKFIVSRADEDIIIIVHNTGNREIYRLSKGEDVPCLAAEFTDEEAREIGAILSGAFYQPKLVDSLELISKEMAFEWIKLTLGHPFINKSIGELAIRKKTGTSVIAILRKEGIVPNPTPDEVFRPEDTLVVIGTRDQFQTFKKYMSQR